MNDAGLIILVIVGVVFCFIGLKVLSDMPGDFLRSFEESCKESIKKRDEEFEKREKFYKDRSDWLSH